MTPVAEIRSSPGFPLLIAKGTGSDLFHMLTEKSRVWAPPSHTLLASGTVLGARISPTLPTTASLGEHLSSFSLFPKHLEEKQEYEQELYCLSKSMTLYLTILGHSTQNTVCVLSLEFEWACDVLVMDRVEWKWSWVTCKARYKEGMKLLPSPQNTHFPNSDSPGAAMLWGSPRRGSIQASSDR